MYGYFYTVEIMLFMLFYILFLKKTLNALKKHSFMYLFIFVWARSFLLHGLFSSCSEKGLLFLEVHRLLFAVGSLVEHRL